MIEREQFRQPANGILETNDVEQILSSCFFSRSDGETSEAATRCHRPEHYKVICISLYNDDLERLDKMVANLKLRGLTKASRSALIRFALSKVDLDRVPKGL
jgi:hypothetical protein